MSSYAGQCPVCKEWLDTAEELKAHQKKHAPKQFTLTELYGWYIPMPTKRNGEWDEPKPCLVCGAVVSMPDVHRTWHNKQEAK